MDDLSDSFDVVAWDAPGCGSSDDPPATFRTADFADCAAALVTELGLQHPHVVGLSWGSAVALELYRRHPALPRSLVLVSAYAGWAGSLPPDEIDRRLEVFRRDSRLPPLEFARTWIPTLFTSHAASSDVKEAVGVIADYHPEGMATILASMAETDLREALPLVAAPTLLVHGEADVRSPLTVANELRRSIPGSRLVTIPEVGHYCTIEAAPQFNRIAREFLRSVDE